MYDVDDATKALNFLKATDKEGARLKARFNMLDDRKKTVLAMIYNELEGPQGDKEKKAYADQRYRDHLKEIQDAQEEYLIIYNQRKSAELQIEMWRSINSNQRKGNI